MNQEIEKNEEILKKISNALQCISENKDEIENYTHALYDFFFLLKTWNKKINLVSKIEIEDFIYRHALDSLSALDCIELRKNDVVIDIGSGAGFPGIPIKIKGFHFDKINNTFEFVLKSDGQLH